MGALEGGEAAGTSAFILGPECVPWADPGQRVRTRPVRTRGGAAASGGGDKDKPSGGHVIRENGMESQGTLGASGGWGVGPRAKPVGADRFIR